MSVKKVMPKGGRKPSKTLWAMVRGLADEEWRMVAAFALIHHKGSLQLKLLTLLRTMEVYDPVSEKAAFADNDLKSLRKTAKRWLVRTASRLALYPNEVADQILDVDVLLKWGIHDDTMEFIEEAKRLAKEQEEFGWLALLYKKELKVVSIIFEGDERVERVGKITKEAMENGKLVAMDAEIDHHTAMFLEVGRNGLLMTGKFDTELATSYFRSKFYRQKIEGWPISFQVQKLRIDEAIHYYSGDSAQAAKAAERLLELSERLEIIRKRNIEDTPRCLFRLTAYYTELEKKSQVLATLEILRRRAEVDFTFPYPYLRRFVHILLRTSFVFQFPNLSEEGLRLWNENQAIFNSLPKDAIKFETLLFICAHHISKGSIQAARETFGEAVEVSDTFPYTTYQAVFKILHLMILLDEEDERGLNSFGKNYKLHLRALLRKDKNSVVAHAGLEIMMLLCKESNLEGKSKLNVSLQKLHEKLTMYQQLKENTFNPFIYPMLKWVELRLKP